jgi:mutator protein MutT
MIKKSSKKPAIFAVLTLVAFFGNVRYLNDMRKGIDYIGVGVGAIIFDERGRIFLARRGTEAQNERGRWEFPGGGVEFGETLVHSIVREIAEEYGFVIEVKELLDVVDHILPDEQQHWISPVFICRMKGGTPHIREPHKCDEIGWFAPDRIPLANLTSASQKSLESLKRKMRDWQKRG